MLEVEVFGGDASELPTREEIERLCTRVAARVGIEDGHLAVQFVSAERIADLNLSHRGKHGSTDVLSFPIDGSEPMGGDGPPREFGDIVICPERTADLREAIVHGALHLVGMDHETDGGEMLALQAELLRTRSDTRSGLVALAGRPNVGKSTLLNAIVGAKVAIVSDRPQTTRRAIRGVRTDGDRQVVFVDLPGVQRPRDALTDRMAPRVRQELDGCDVALLVLNAEQGVGPGDRFIAESLAQANTPVVTALNKIDRLDRAGTLAALGAAAELDVGGEIFPISARTGVGVDALVEHLARLMPPGPFLFGADALSDQPLWLRLAELIREAAIRRTYRELPHAVEVLVEAVERQRDDLVEVRALIWVESDSQKGIVLGAGGRMVKAIGTAARRELERELESHVHLDLSVRVRRDWRGDDGLLDRLGYI